MTIVWSKTAVDDLKRLRAYIDQRDPTAAARVAGAIVGRVESLTEFPAQGRPGRVPHTRELVVPHTPFLVVYTVAENDVQIVSILHAARRWPA